MIKTNKALHSKITGTVYGRIAGIILGKPLEIGMTYKQVEEYLKGADAWPLNDFVPEYSEGTDKHCREDCIPSTKGNVRFAQTDDDINYTLLALKLAEDKGLNFTNSDIAKLWLDNIPANWVFCASRDAYKSLLNGVNPDDVNSDIGEWAECIDGQIRSDMWGYILPGKPKEAAEAARRDCSFSLRGAGVHGGMFVAAAIAEALTYNPSPESILSAGLSVLPGDCEFSAMVKAVTNKYKETESFDETIEMIYEKYGSMSYAMTVNNMACVVLSLLHGKLDYTKSITTAVMCGMDTDCNAGTVGSIVGAAVGIDGIESRWYEPLNDKIKSSVACFGEVRLSEIAERIYKLSNNTPY